MAATSFEAGIGSASTDGEAILIGTSTTTVHTATTTSGEVDEVYIWASNVDTANSVEVTVETFDGSTTVTEAKLLIPPRRGYYVIWPGCRVQGGLEVRLVASTANDLYARVNVNTVTNA